MFENRPYKLDEVEQLTGIKIGTLRQRLNRKLITGVKVPDGKKLVWALMPKDIERLQGESQAIKKTPYETAVAKWEEEQRTGYRREKPLENWTVERNGYGITAFWDYLDGVKPCEQKEVPERRKLLAQEKNLDRFTLDSIMLAISKVPRTMPSSRESIYKATMSLWRSLVYQGLRSELDLNRFKTFRPKPNKRPKREYVDAEMFAELLLANRAWYAGRSKYDRVLSEVLLYTLYYTGTRNTEVCNLLLPDVDFRKKQIFIEKSKNDKDRDIGLPAELVQPLKDYLEHRPKASKFKNFFLQEDGTPLNRRVISERIGDVGDKIGADIRPHDFRRTLITDLLTEGAPTVLVQKIVGHENISTTQLYDMTTDRDALDLMRKRGTAARQQAKEPAAAATHFEF